ncbi:hypothetical protein [Methylocapsa sp. S129]|uniref:hypothetical protein n=1 Tax=Methylocapsa sp. S129 TaxID=1641869 RepID=UPI00131EA6C5|nr:hypothetical protein [Methylocapsa sp. S129]
MTDKEIVPSAARRPIAEFATFWHGPLDAIAYSCLASFASVGASLCVYSYDDKIDAPRGVEVADARRICPDESLLSRYLTGGKPSLASFADMFRYKLIRETGCCWVDTDIICLRKPDFSGDPIVFGRQSNPYGEFLVNNAVLKLPPAHPVLNELIQKAEGAVDIDQKWGAIGPFLLTELVVRHGVEPYARDFFAFYPIEPDDFWKMLAPAYRDDVAAAVKQATFLHLWGEMFGRSGYDKTVCPPVGSFLHEIFQRLGTLHRFKRVYDERELRSLMAKWMPQDDLSNPAVRSA